MSNYVNQDLVAVLDRLGTPRICVVGDLILDRYVWGGVERVSPEAPVPVLKFEGEEDRLGGAAAVANLAKVLGSQVDCVGVIGGDSAGQTLISLLEQAGVQSGGTAIDSCRPTTMKQRFLSRRHGHMQLLRLDREATTPISAELENRLYESLTVLMARADAVAISDYGKGVCSPRLLRMLLDAASELGRPTLVDPARGVDFARYTGATLLAPNRVEMETASGERVQSPEDAMDIGARWVRRWGIGTLIIKLDQQGLVLCPANETAAHFPSRIRAVSDITGAGDTVLAVLAMALGREVPWGIACQLANCAGGLQVERVGVTTLSRNELRDDLTRENSARSLAQPSRIVTLAEAVRRSQQVRAAGKRVVFTNGCFAALHAGHVAYLREAKSIGDYLIVAINSTDSICRLKGARPIIPDADRLVLIAALEFVDCVMLFDEDSPERLLREIHPDVLVKGGTTEVIIGREVVESYGGQVLKLGRTPGISTSQMIDRTYSLES